MVDEQTLRQLGITDGQLAAIEDRERAELDRRILRFRGPGGRIESPGGMW